MPSKWAGGGRDCSSRSLSELSQVPKISIYCKIHLHLKSGVRVAVGISRSLGGATRSQVSSPGDTIRHHGKSVAVYVRLYTCYNVGL